MFQSTIVRKFWFTALVLLAVALPVSANSVETANAILSRAQALNREGGHQLEIGQAEAALETWKRAEAAYSEAGDETGKLGSQLNQVQALQALGQYRHAKSLLEQINSRLQPLPDSQLKAKTLQSLGIALLRIGDLKESYEILQSSLLISQRLKDDTGSTLLALGNVTRVRDEQIKTIELKQ
jgi:tetratricopeptide (TPR) repeat protein